jgi:hypothetical protein
MHPLPLPSPRDAEEAQKLREAYAAGAADVIEAAAFPASKRAGVLLTIRQGAAKLWPSFPAPQRA